jgi:hypothetical protein
MTTQRKWSPKSFLICDDIKQAKSFAVIVLNRPISVQKEIVKSLWNHGEIAFNLAKIFFD